MAVTTLTAGLTGLLLLALSARVILARWQEKSLENGADILQRRIRGQANLIEYAPIALILLALLEYQQAPGWFVWAMATLFLAGRIFHGYAFGFSSYSSIGRVGGTAMTLLALGLLSAGALVMALAVK